jgi:O-antigen/teichoic acid export membrane protein
LGIEQIGLWSLITAITSFGNIGTFGFSGSLIKYTAELQSRKQGFEIIGVLNSCILIITLFLLVFLAIIYVASILFLDLIIDIRFLKLGFSLLPFSFLIFYFTSMGSLILSVIEGLNKNWQKNIILIMSTLVLLFCVPSFIQKYGIYGLFYSQIIQAVCTFILSFLLIKLNIKQYKFSTFTTNRELIIGIANYGLKFQLVSILQMLCEPITKFFLSRYGGLSLLGVFEMASRLIIQTRIILSTMTTNLLPKLVDVNITQSKEKVQELFIKVFKLNYDIFSIVFGLILLFCPIIVRLWLGEINEELIFMIRILTVAWFINSTMIVPYVYNLGSGDLKANIISHGLMASLNLTFGLGIALFNLDAYNFVYGWALSLIIGSIYLLVEYTKRNKINIYSIFFMNEIVILSIVLINFVMLYFTSKLTHLNLFIIYSISALIYISMTFIYFIKSKSYQLVKSYFSTFISISNKILM